MRARYRTATMWLAPAFVLALALQPVLASMRPADPQAEPVQAAAAE